MYANLFFSDVKNNMEVRKSNNVSFSADIKFVPYAFLQQEAKKHGCKIVSESPVASKIVASRSNLFSEGISYCVGGVAKFSRNNSVANLIDKLKIRKKRGFHILPEGFFNVGGEDQFKSFDNYIKGLRKQSNVKAFIIGGVAEDSFSKFLLSLRVIKFFNRTFNKFEKDVTIFFGQNSKNVIDKLDLPESSFLYLPNEKTILVNCRVLETKLSSDGGASRAWEDLLDLNGIKNNFQHIKISPNDSVYIRGKKIPPELLEKN